MLPLLLHLQLDRLSSLTDKDDKTEVLSHSPCSLTLWDVKDPTHQGSKLTFLVRRQLATDPKILVARS